MTNVAKSTNVEISNVSKSNEIKIKLASDNTLIDSEISEAIQKAQITKDKAIDKGKIQHEIDITLRLIKHKWVNTNETQKAEFLEFFNKNIDYKFLPIEYKKGFAFKNGAVVKFELSENKIRFQKSDFEVKAERFHIREFAKYTFDEILAKFDMTLLDNTIAKEKIDKFKSDEKTAMLDKATKLAESNNEVGLYVGREITRDLAKTYSRAIQIKINPKKVETTTLAQKAITAAPKNMVVTKRKTPKVAPPKSSKKAA